MYNSIKNITSILVLSTTTMHRIQLLSLRWRKYPASSDIVMVVLLNIQTSVSSADRLTLSIWMWRPGICNWNNVLFLSIPESKTSGLQVLVRWFGQRKWWARYRGWYLNCKIGFEEALKGNQEGEWRRLSFWHFKKDESGIFMAPKWNDSLH